MRFTRWLNPMLPQTLQIATLLFYITAAFDVLFGQAFRFPPFGLLLTLGALGAGLGIANTSKAGYKLAVAVSALGLLFAMFVVVATGSGFALIGAIFPAALFALVVHPQSREYQRLWFE
jgi:hypothetical protein